jgi:1-acyl-sn-glycerol-3-phosphate acyltransferase
VKFGEPLDFSRYRGQPTDGALLRSITDEIMQAIAKLSGQEYVDMDARRAKAELAAAARHGAAASDNGHPASHDGHPANEGEAGGAP